MGNGYTTISTGKNATGLGDVLCLTPLLRHVDNPIVVLHSNAGRFSKLFDGMCPVMINDNYEPQKQLLDGHTTKQMFNALQIDSNDILPSIMIRGKEIAEARRILRGIKPPVFIVSVNCDKKWKHVRECQIEKWENLVSRTSASFIQVGTSSNYTRINKCALHLVDCDLRVEAAIYALVGYYVGISTGPEHLMLAVGGSVLVAIPEDQDGYQSNLWKHNSPRCSYIPFSKIDTIDLTSKFRL